MKEVSQKASELSSEASISGIRASFQRRMEDWVFQKQLAERELKMVEKQIISAQIREQIAEKELENHDQSIDQKKTELEFMQDKFSNQDLYNWMINQLSVTYFQSYQMAYQMAKQAERCYKYELADASDSFVSFGYWDSLKKGLLSSEKLEHDLMRMEASYMEKNRRVYEINKTVSLDMWNPEELLKLKSTGACTIKLLEEMFDLDHPGHYLRRIKSVNISIPCVAGPYTGVNGKLTLRTNSIRKSAITPADGYARDYSDSDTRFIDDFAAIQSIATSSGQNDSGMFNLNFNDERYLPFEGAGVISEWKFELPEEFRKFDYNTISDLIITIQYTAKDGGDLLKKEAVKNLSEFVKPSEPTPDTYILNRLFSLQHEFGNEFYLFKNPVGSSNNSTDLILNQNHFPFYLKNKTIAISKISAFVKPKSEELDLSSWEFKINNSAFMPFNELSTNDFTGLYVIEFAPFTPEISISSAAPETSLNIRGTFVIDEENPIDWNSAVEDIFLLVEYSAD
jgi:hypothetical protein